MDEPSVKNDKGHNMESPFVPNFVNKDLPCLVLMIGQTGSGIPNLKTAYEQQGFIPWQPNGKIDANTNYILDISVNDKTLAPTLNQFKTAGFQIEATVVSVPNKVSWLSVLENQPNNMTK